MHEIIGVIFDFDDTLAPDTTSAFLASLGLDVDHFWQQRVAVLLEDGWDPMPAYLHEMIVESRRRNADDRITHDRLAAFGRAVEFFPGVEDIFDSLRTEVTQIDVQIAVEFYLISSGIRSLLTATAIADQFTDLWASDFHYNDSGAIDAVKNVISFTEKTRLLFQISKGMVGEPWRTQFAEVNRKMSFSAFRIPFRQMIVVGDGQTDVPCFSVVNRYGGTSLAVCDLDHPSKWDKARLLMTDQRVESVYAADFRESSGLGKNLLRAVREIAEGIIRERDAAPSSQAH